MGASITYTSTLPGDLMGQLNEFSQKLGLPKNKLIERSLRLYLERLKQLEYIRSFQRAKEDSDLLQMAEEGLEEYLQSLDEL